MASVVDSIVGGVMASVVDSSVGGVIDSVVDSSVGGVMASVVDSSVGGVMASVVASSVGGVMVSVFDSSVVYRGLVSRSGKSSNYSIGMCCFTASIIKEKEERRAKKCWFELKMAIMLEKKW
jgi:hypothetical protein